MKKLAIIIILSFAITIVTSFTIWAHHIFVTGLNPFLGAIFLLVSIILAVPIFIFLFRKLSTFLKGKINFTPDVLFLIGFFSFSISDILSSIFIGNSTLDLHVHDTYYVIANAHVMISIAIIFGIFSAIYHWFPKIFGRQMNYPLGYIHFWITLIGAYLIFWPMHYEGLAGMPRRYMDYGKSETIGMFKDLK